jgi:glycerol-3-phosphate acyltransferase PlsY
VFRYISLGSVIAAAALPFLIFAFREYSGLPSKLIIIAAASLFIIVKHHENIRRLLAGTEHKIGKRAV